MDDLISKKDLDDQAILVPADVNHDQVVYLIGAGTGGLHLGETGPVRFAGELIPSRQSLLGVSMHLPELPQPSPRDHVHAEFLRIGTRITPGIVFRKSRKHNGELTVVLALKTSCCLSSQVLRLFGISPDNDTGFG